MTKVEQNPSPDRERGTSPAAGSGGGSLGRPLAGSLPVLLAGAGAVGVLVLALVLGGGRPEPAPGLGDPGPITGWGLPIAKLALDLAAAATVGSLLYGLLTPAKRGALQQPALRAVRVGGTLAWVWVAAAVGTLALTLSDFVGTPPFRTDYQATLAFFIGETLQGRALAVVVVLTVVLAAATRNVETLNGTALLLLLALAAVVPPPLTGHSASAANHDLATSSLLVHVVAVTLWVGGLFALALYGRRTGSASRVAAGRFSKLALWCFGAAALSGLMNAWLRLGEVSQIWESRYGWLTVGKAVFLVGLGWFGYQHRERTLPALGRGAPGAFRRFAGVEAGVMAATVALGVALSRTPPPVPEDGLEDGGRALALIGFPVPPISFERVMTLWRPDALVLVVAALAVVGYGVGLRRMRAQSLSWPVGRTIAWFSGVAIGIFVLCSGMATYAPAMFSVHMVQHMVLSMLIPILLALGAPITLALRALPARAATPEDRGLRQWILTVLHSRALRVLTNPVVTLTLYIITLYAFYFSPLFGWVMGTHETHLLMIVHFLLVGSLYFWPIVGLDPIPRRLPPLGRMLLLFASMPFHAFFGVIVMMSETVIGAEWYSALNFSWVDPLADQNVGGGIAWGTAEIPVLIVLGVVFVAWYRSEERAAKRADRHGQAEWEAYNAELARLSRGDPGE